MSMRRILKALTVFSFVPVVAAQTEYYVRFTAQADATAAGAWQPKLMPPGVWDWYHLSHNNESRSAVADALGLPLEDVLTVGAGQVERADSVKGVYAPADPLFSFQWHHKAINTVGAYRHAQVSQHQNVVRVAVVDSGIWAAHEDLTVVDGWCPWMSSVPANPTSSPLFDECEHGTHVAGILAAGVNNTVGVAGVAERIELYSLRCLDWCSGTLADVTDATIIGAFYFECDIISLSLQWQSPYQPWTDACDLLESRGTFMVVAAGNFNNPSVSQAAIHPWSIAVGATDDHANLAWFSNHGQGLDLVAPGVNILSTMIGSNQTGNPAISIYTLKSGTSMAAPLVTGVLANMLAVVPAGTDAHELRADLLASCDPHQNTFLYGAGYLNATRAMIVAKSKHACLADLDLNGEVNVFDLITFQSAFASGDPLTDFTGDGQFDIFDFLIFQNAFITPCP